MDGETSQAVLPVPAGRPLGVLDAMSLGWRLLVSDFWRLWLVGLVLLAVLMGAGMFGLPAGILITPPMMAGLLYVLRRRMDGGPAAVGDLFAGFKQRFGESVVGYLPVSLGSVVIATAFVLALWLLIGVCILIVAAAEGDEGVAVVTVACGILVFLALEFCLLAAMTLLALFFYLVPAAVWDHPGSGWEAAKASARLVWDHFGSMLGFVVLFALVSSAANVLGMLACCVGWVFTTPAVIVWFYATLLYMYRSWTGQKGGTAVPDAE
jgi:hypothetical protein